MVQLFSRWSVLQSFAQVKNTFFVQTLYLKVLNISILDHHLDILKRGIAEKFGDGNGLSYRFLYIKTNVNTQPRYNVVTQIGAMRT